MKKIPTVPELDNTKNLRQFVEANSDSGQVIPLAAWTTINYENIVYNLNANYSAGVFTAGHKGLYNVEGSFGQSFDPSGNFTLYIRVLITGLSGTREYSVAQSEDNSSTSFNWERSINKNIYLEAGDTVQFQIFNNIFSGPLSGSSAATSMSIVELERLD